MGGIKYTHEGKVDLDGDRRWVKLKEESKHWVDENGRRYNKRRPWCGRRQLILGSVRELGAIS